MYLELGLTANAIRRPEHSEPDEETEIAEIDQDGFFLSHFGPLRDLPQISSDDFFPRNRLHLQLVAKGNLLGIKKHFQGNEVSFLRELMALYYLGTAKCNVPSLLDVNFDDLTITVSYIKGKVLREELAIRGALLRDRDVDNNPDFIGLSAEDRWLKRIEEGRRFLHDTIDRIFIERLFEQLDRIHQARFILNDIKYGNIIIDADKNEPYFIDFEYSEFYNELDELSFSVLKEKDIKILALHFLE